MYWKLLLIALPVFFVIDIIWIGFVARRFYDAQLGDLRAPQVNWAAAILFYLVFLVGLVVFVIEPAMAGESLSTALWRGAFFGLVTYATYDLTNLATLRDWPVTLVVVDMIWGVVLAGSVSVGTYAIARALNV